MLGAACTTHPILAASTGLDIFQCYPTRCCVHTGNYIDNLSTRVLTLAAGTPPAPDVHRLLSPHWARGVVMHIVFVNGFIMRLILRDEREVRQVNRVELIKGSLALGSISRPQFLRQKRVQRVVAVESKVPTAIIIGSSRNLVTLYVRGVITVVGVRWLKLRQLILIRVTLRQDVAEEGAGRGVLDVDLDTDRPEVLLQDQLVGGTPGIFGCRRVLELQPLAIFRAYAIGPFRPSSLVDQRVRGCGIKFRAGCIRLKSRNNP